MSAETEMATLITHASNAASALASNAESLINQATAALSTTLDFPGVGTNTPNDSRITNIGRTFGVLDSDSIPYNQGKPLNTYFGGLVGGVWVSPNKTLSDEEPPISFPSWPSVSLGNVPSTQDIDLVNLDIEKLDFPELKLPTFRYSKIARPIAFSGAIPDSFVEKPIPPIPSGDSIHSSKFITPLVVDKATLNYPEITLDNLDVDLPEWNNPFAAAFNQLKDKFGEVTSLIDELGRWYQTDLTTVLATTLNLLDVSLQNKWGPIWTKYTKLRERLTGRLVEEEDRVKQVVSNKSGWGVPAAVAIAQSAWIAQLTEAWKNYAEEQVDIEALKLAVDWFQVCGELTTSFTTTIQKLKEKEIQLLIEAHKTSLIYAKATIAALLAKYDAETIIKASLMLQREEAQLKVFEAELTIALLQFESAQFAIKSEEARQDFDKAQVKKLHNEAASAQQTARRVASLVTAARSEVSLRKLPIEQFELKVKAFNAKVNAHEAQVEALIAEVEEDQAKVTGQLKKLAGYEANVKAFQSLIEAKQLRAEAQSTRNAAVIDEFQQRVKATLAPIEKSVLDANYDLRKYEVQVEQLIADAQLVLETAKLELDYHTKQQEGQREAYQLEQERDFEVAQSELRRLEAVAEVNAHGASVMEEMSRGAMAAVTGVANVVFSEEA